MPPAADLARLQEALVNADKAGDVAAATAIAQELRRQSSPTGTDQAMGLAKAAGSGLAEGALGATVGAAGDLGAVGKATQGWADRQMNLPPLVQQVMSGLRTVTNPFAAIAQSGALPTTPEISKTLGVDYTPQTKPEEYAKSMAGGAGGMILPISKTKLIARELLGLAMGAGGQGGADLAGPEHGTAGRIGGSALAAFGPLLAQGSTPSIVRALQQVTKDIPEGATQAAGQAAKVGGDTLGTRMLLSQGYDEPNALWGVTRQVAESPQGAAVRRVLEKQPKAALDKAEEFVKGTSAFGSGRDEANLAQAAGQKAMQAPDVARAQAVDPLYAAAAKDTMQPNEVSAIAEALAQARGDKFLDPGSSAGRAMSTTARKLERTADAATGKSTILGPDGKPFESTTPVPVLQVESLAREPKAQLRAVEAKDPMSASVKPGSEVGLAATGATMNKATGAASPTLAQARIAGKVFHQGPIEEMKQGPMTDLFDPKEGAKGDYSRMTRIFGPDYGPQDISTVGEHLRAQDPEAFPILAKQRFQTLLDSTVNKQSGTLAENFLNDFPDKVRGATTNERAKFDATMQQVALSRGLDPDAMTSGANKVMDAMEMAARARTNPAQFDSTAFNRAAGAPITEFTARVPNFLMPLRVFGSAVNNAVLHRTYTRLADLLTSDGGARKLVEISKYSPTQARFAALVQDALGIKGEVDATSQGR